MTIDTVLVTGATGKTGRRVADRLVDRGVTVRAASRSGDVRFDWHDDTGWRAAASGADAAYLVMPSSGSPEAVDQVARFTEIARDAGVRRAVLVSVPAVGGLDPAMVGATEDALRQSGLEWTALRLRWFSQNFSEDFLLDGVMARELRLPAGDGREAFVDADDIAEVAAVVLTEDGHSGRAYEVTGPRLMSFADAAAEISAALGSTVRYVALSPDEYAEEQRMQGAPAEWIALSRAIYAPFRTRALETLSSDVEGILGRPPRDFSEYAREAAATGVWAR